MRLHKTIDYLCTPIVSCNKLGMSLRQRRNLRCDGPVRSVQAISVALGVRNETPVPNMDFSPHCQIAVLVRQCCAIFLEGCCVRLVDGGVCATWDGEVGL
jgi:hypothetical protein